ncbi:DUF262 domain-containing protein [Streptomyces sp. PSKA54]|uniref:DUF262 domain-containing protein n=1 Tax=Streptomyces himalayensis subsp. aureolus TaxID=2758039 RepID=A0A7W2D8V7_9ACTN|nr:DUF262 domain-containing protein [Streptomyces himalayensis]MBA4866707.1 DUF262 domain-containing protein [Streptomyces himalayensis subsp. aureolus]
MPRERRQTTQTVAWFRDLWARELLELDPPYQRRSVWNQSYKDYFIETLMLQYPAPAIFIYENMSADGIATYSVVDGKQRLSAIFEFTSSQFPVSEKSAIKRARGLFFNQLSEEERKEFWSYQFAVEYLPTTDDSTLNNIFDRINRNVARLTPQELRHARYNGQFARTCEELAEILPVVLAPDFPRFAPASRRQMKDVEFVTNLLLLTEEGVRAYSQDDLDREYGSREDEWSEQQRVDVEFRETIRTMSEIYPELLSGAGKRLKNQADFYSLYGAILELSRQGALPGKAEMNERLASFMNVVVNDDDRTNDDVAKRYFEAARSASNDALQRRTRIAIVKDVLTGVWGAGTAKRL